MEHTELSRQYQKREGRRRLALALLIAAIVALGLWFITLGTASTGPGTVLRAVSALLSGTLEGSEEAAEYKIILLLRLPRLAAAVAAGVGLAAAGTGMQAVTGNPLVSPFTVGVSSAAAFGASVAIVLLGVTSLGGELTIVLCAFGCAVGCAVLVYLVCAAAGMSPESVVLAGTAMSYLFSAGSSALQFFADEHQLSDVVQWTFGSLNGISWREVGIMALFVAPCSLALRRFALAFNAMAAGEDGVVRGLGVNPAAVRVTAGLLSILMTAAIISFTGVIGFVGLIAPHIARFVVGGDHRFLLPFSGAVGALLLMAADTVGKVILAPVTIPVGIVVSFLGVPLFLNLILTGRKRFLR